MKESWSSRHSFEFPSKGSANGKRMCFVRAEEMWWAQEGEERKRLIATSDNLPRWNLYKRIMKEEKKEKWKETDCLALSFRQHLWRPLQLSIIHTSFDLSSSPPHALSCSGFVTTHSSWKNEGRGRGKRKDLQNNRNKTKKEENGFDPFITFPIDSSKSRRKLTLYHLFSSCLNCLHVDSVTHARETEKKNSEIERHKTYKRRDDSDDKKQSKNYPKNKETHNFVSTQKNKWKSNKCSITKTESGCLTSRLFLAFHSFCHFGLTPSAVFYCLWFISCSFMPFFVSFFCSFDSHLWRRADKGERIAMISQEQEKEQEITGGDKDRWKNKINVSLCVSSLELSCLPCRLVLSVSAVICLLFVP